MEAGQNDQQELLTLKERIDREVDLAYVRHGYVIGDGEKDQKALEDKVFGLVSVAVVEKRSDRGKLAVTRRSLVSSVFPQVAGPEAWAEQDDPELAKGVYNRLDGVLWRLASAEADGKIQERLNSDIGLILCRTKATPDKVDAAYVTKDLNCLLADFTSPQRDRITKEANRFATNLTMAIERLPVHATRFKSELNGGMKTALATATAIMGPALEAAAVGNDGDDGGE